MQAWRSLSSCLDVDTAQSLAVARDAATALQIAVELREDGDPGAARSCIKYAVGRARVSASLVTTPLAKCFDEADRLVLMASEPPNALVMSLSLAVAASLAHDADDLDEARSAFEESLSVWPGNALARCKLADLELQHGSFRRAALLYATVAAQSPCAALASASTTPSWYTQVMAQRSSAVAMASYSLALLLHRVGRCEEAIPHLIRLGIAYRLSPSLWAAVAERPDASLPPMSGLGPSVVADVVRYADAVPAALLKTLQEAFSPRSPFWSETNYKDRGYMSFW